MNTNKLIFNKSLELHEPEKTLKPIKDSENAHALVQGSLIYL